MKKLIIFVLILAVIAGVAYATCPDRTAHADAVKELCNTAISNELNPEGSSDFLGLASGLASLGTEFAGLFVDNSLVVDNYYVCSIGKIEYDGQLRTVSVGVFGHVFTLSEEALKAAVQEEI